MFLKMLFVPNRYSFIGFFISILGFLLMPLLIGLIIMPVGILIMLYGIMLSVWEVIPGHERLEPKIKTFKDQYIESSPILTLLFKRKNSK